MLCCLCTALVDAHRLSLRGACMHACMHEGGSNARQTSSYHMQKQPCSNNIGSTGADLPRHNAPRLNSSDLVTRFDSYLGGSASAVAAAHLAGQAATASAAAAVGPLEAGVAEALAGRASLAGRAALAGRGGSLPPNL